MEEEDLQAWEAVGRKWRGGGGNFSLAKPRGPRTLKVACKTVCEPVQELRGGWGGGGGYRGVEVNGECICALGELLRARVFTGMEPSSLHLDLRGYWEFREPL